MARADAARRPAPPTSLREVTTGWPEWTDPVPVARLREAVRTKPSHAYLVSGPKGIGKAAIARAFAQALCCLRPDPGDPSLPCGQCRSCLTLMRGGHPDVVVMDIASQAVLAEKPSRATTLNIDSIRRLRSEATLLPVAGDRRVFIIDDAETMQEPAQQAMLKILEEPPQSVTLILVSDEIESLLPTVRSRCQEIAVRLLPQHAIATVLTRRGISPPIANEIAALSMGRPGWALAAAADPAMLQARRDEWRDAITWISASPYDRLVTAFRLGEQFGKRPSMVFGMLGTVAAAFRQAMLSAAGKDCRFDVSELSGPLVEMKGTPLAFGQAIEATMRCLTDLEANVRPRLALEAMVLAWPNPGSA
ncbi:MAG: AAA family ATPase [Thermomicrobiales bacterium]